MTLPNKLTILRILFIPVMVIIYYIPPLRDNTIFFNISIANFTMCLIFALASFTDFLDGSIARKRNLVTTFGKFADPLADKILVFSALLILLAQGAVPAWMIITIIAREFIVSGIRLVAVEQGSVIAASKLGKYKTATTMVAIGVMFFYQAHEAIEITGTVLMYISVALTVISGIDYFWKNRKPILKSI